MIRLIDVEETVRVPFATPIALVRPDERYEMTVYGTQVQYRRLPVSEVVRIEQQSQRGNGSLAPAGRARDLELQYSVLDWQGLEDTHGHPVAVTIPLQETLLRALPFVVKGAFKAPSMACWPEEMSSDAPPAQFTVRRILEREMQQLRAEHTVRGDLHLQALWLAVVQHCLKDWSQVLDAGHPVPLSPEASARLPIDAIMAAWQSIIAAEVQHEAELENLG